jgi:hypothetical protein
MNRVLQLMMVAVAAAFLGLTPIASAQAPADEPAAAEADDEAVLAGDDAADPADEAEGTDGTDGSDAAAAAAAEADVELPPEESPFSMGLIISYIALFLGGGAAVLGIWVDRDKTRPVIFGATMSLLIITAVCVGAVQGLLDAQANIQKRQDLARMLEMVNEIARKSGDPELIALAQAETGETIVPDPKPVEEEPTPADDGEGEAEGDDANPDGDAPGAADAN